MKTPLHPTFITLTVLTLLHFIILAHAQITVRSIPSTEGNQEFFSLAQSLIVEGERKISSCGPDLLEIERCIRVCNSPGLAERGGCCCVARPNDFTIGLRGGCRYSQRVQNFTTHFIYKSSPVNSPNGFFDGKNCDKNSPSGTGAPCTCSIQWEADTEVLEMLSPLPTPSASPSPVLTATPSPVPSQSPVPTPEPSLPLDTFEPTTEETITPTPDSELIPIPTGPPLPSPSPEDPKDTDPPVPTDGATPTEGVVPTDEDPTAPSPTMEAPTIAPEDEAEQQASEDDGSICVDERYLKERGFGPDTLIHEQAIMADVLCPHGRSLPCGTRDHKVRFAGQDMSYEYMCARPDVHCRATRMKVNAVYTHLWTDVPHEDVMLTMFDIRYSETAQKVLHTVMRGWRTAKNRVLA